jgi:hypothetical protein
VISGLLAIAALSIASAQSGQPMDPNIQYVGRWDKSASTSYHSYWGGAYLKVRFTGTTVKVNLGKTATLLVNIDDTTDQLFSNVSGTVNLTPTALPAGTHTVRIGAEFDQQEIVFNGLILDAGATTVAPLVAGNKIIEFIGDSITTGADNPFGDGDCYAWLAGDLLGAEHTQISKPGIALVDGINSLPGMEVAYYKFKSPDYTTSNPTWNFAYTPQAVVVNLGANDHYANVGSSVFQTHYINFLASLRQHYPQIDIFALRQFNGWYETETHNAVNARISAGDSKVHYIDTTGWLVGYGTSTTTDYVNKTGGSVHPSRSGHVKVAKHLGPILQPYLALPFVQYRVEAEDMALSNYAVESNGSASFLNNVRVPTSGTGVASYTFGGASGTYDVQVNYFDENDGASAFSLYVGSTLVGSWTANRSLGSASAVQTDLVQKTFAGVTIPSGSVVSVHGTFNSGEAARFDRLKLFSLGGTGSGGPITYEAESLSYALSTGVTSETWNDGASAGGWVKVLSNSVGDYIEFSVPVPAAGTYAVNTIIRTASTRGIAALSIDGTSVGGAIDMYAASSSFVSVSSGAVTFPTAGTRRFRYTVTGRNNSSTGYQLGFDYIKLTPQ